VKPSGYHGAAKFAKGLPEPPEHLLCLQFPTDSRKFTARPLERRPITLHRILRRRSSFGIRGARRDR
jgi:hypothetical protein